MELAQTLREKGFTIKCALRLKMSDFVFCNGKELGDESYPKRAKVPALPGD